MANFELKFKCNSKDGSSIKCEHMGAVYSRPNEVYICIQTDFGDILEVFLDKSTAIKFAKTLRTEINKITESEVSNG